MIEIATIQVGLRVASAIIVLWMTSVYVRRYRVLWPFYPLMVYFLALIFTAAADFYEIAMTDLQAIFDAIFLVFYIWILAVLVRLARPGKNTTKR